MPISIEVRNIEKLEKMGLVITGTKNKLLSDLVRLSKKFGETAVLTAKSKYLSGPRPEKLGVGKGRLRASISSRVDQDGNIISTSIGSNIVYAAIHEMGGQTKPHVIYPKAKPFLAFQKDSKWIFTRKPINHPGSIIPPRPFLRPALEDGMPTFQGNIARVLGNLNFVGGPDGE